MIQVCYETKRMTLKWLFWNMYNSSVKKWQAYKIFTVIISIYMWAQRTGEMILTQISSETYKFDVQNGVTVTDLSS